METKLGPWPRKDIVELSRCACPLVFVLLLFRWGVSSVVKLDADEMMPSGDIEIAEETGPESLFIFIMRFGVENSSEKRLINLYN